MYQGSEIMTLSLQIVVKVVWMMEIIIFLKKELGATM